MASQKSTITHARLLEIMHYSVITGLFTALVERGPVKPGMILGTTDLKGYLTVAVDGKRYYLHRLAWFYLYGKWPDQIDHKNMVKNDNRFLNLREADNHLNQANIKAYGKWKEKGLKGVSEVNGRYCSQITVKGVKHYLGCFATPEEAGEAYKVASLKFHGEFSPFFERKEND